MMVTLSSRPEISRATFNEKNKDVNEGWTLSTNTINSHNEEHAVE